MLAVIFLMLEYVFGIVDLEMRVIVDVILTRLGVSLVSFLTTLVCLDMRWAPFCLYFGT